jgi:hypothetical protein
MSAVQTTDLGTPDEVRTYHKGKLEIYRIGGQTFARPTYEPGFHWRDDAGAGVEWCRVHHVGIALTGTLHVRLEDGSEYEVRSGSAFSIPPGHDGWVIGNEPWTTIDTVDDASWAWLTRTVTRP